MERDLRNAYQIARACTRVNNLLFAPFIPTVYLLLSPTVNPIKEYLILVYVLASQKGGVGKSSLAQNLAAYLKVGDASVLLADTDPQKTTAEWAEEREANGLARIPYIALSGNVNLNLLDMKELYTHIVVDTGGADSREMRSALTVADVVLVPFKPRRRDLKTAHHVAEIMGQAQATNNKLKVFSVVTMAPPANQASRIADAKGVLSNLGLNPLEATTRHINSWDDSEDMGQTVFEYSYDKKAADDARAVFAELIGAL